MFYFLSKTASYLLTPAGWLLILLIGAWRWPRYRRQLAFSSLLLFYLLGNNYLIYHQLARLWEVSGCLPPQPRSTSDTARGGPPKIVAVVLTGGMVNTALPVAPDRPLLGRQADRLGQALYLYKTGRVGQILISGGEGQPLFTGQTVREEGAESIAFLRLAGVPIEVIRWENRSRNTYENALYSARLLRQYYRTNQCVVVTSAFHMRRALACFAREGIDATPFAGAYLQRRGRPALIDLLVPHEETFADATHLIKELIGYITYRIVGYA